MAEFKTLTEAAVAVLREPNPLAKARLSRTAAALWRNREITSVGDTRPPARPARPALPKILAPAKMAKRRITGGIRGRKALLHALVHIELNAIDLAWDLMARFRDRALPYEFYDDWCTVADDEARHFDALRERLEELGGDYGDLPAHDGLWDAAAETRHDVVARLAVVPLVLEARGLDVTPGIIKRLRNVGDELSAKVLEHIYRDEINHVATGRRWFDYACAARGLEPAATWHVMVSRHFKGRLKTPFNHAARRAAGFLTRYYMPATLGPR